MIYRDLFGAQTSTVIVYSILIFFTSCKQVVRLGSEPVPVTEYTAGAAGPEASYTPRAKETAVQAAGGPVETFKCCYFPLDVFPFSYPFDDTSIRSFKSNRDNGARKHAAADLYHKVGAPIYAIDDGEVIDTYDFYSGTYALEVQHPKFIIRYGEIRQKLPSGVAVGAKVKAGQVIAYVGQMECCRPMLHFEMYSGSATGQLTNFKAPPLYRRSDLMNPTSQLLEWQNRLPK
jgi:murein DD-endopeptidase MepM/ murein hydrolase activator NlpD